jgi:hypothetical protein
MDDSELERRAAEFWADTDLADSFPRNIEQAIALKLPVTVVKLPILTIRTIARWLQRHNHRPVFPSYRPDLMGCLYADGGHGFVFLCGADEPEEQRLTLAHDIAHFLVDYWWPRLFVIQTMGVSIIDVLDGHRPARTRERASAILARVRLCPHWHLLPRHGADPDSDGHIACVEDRADNLGRELVAPRSRILQLLRALPPRQRADADAACGALATFFGIPPYVFRAEVAAMHCGHTPSFLDDVLRVLGR